METISSAHNSTFKQLLRLSTSSAERKKTALTICDGLTLARDFLQQGNEAEMVVFDQSLIKTPALAELLIQSSNQHQVCLTHNLFYRISQVETAPGVLLVARPRRLGESELMLEVKKLGDVLVLERVQDPGNLGTILRSALAFGISDVLLSADSVDAWSPKVIRASMGACFNLNIYENLNLAASLAQLKLSHRLLATSPRGNLPLPEAKLNSERNAWLFGNESRGLSQATMAQADNLVLIPQSNKIESLNLSMAVTICLYENWRQTNQK